MMAQMGAPPAAGMAALNIMAAPAMAAPAAAGFCAIPPMGGGMPFGGMGAGGSGKGGGLFGANSCNGKGGGLFGGSSQGCGAGFDSLPPTTNKPATPSQLLDCSDHMHFGAAETPQQATERAVRALRYLAEQAVARHTHVPEPPEDPLVGSLLGPLVQPAAARTVHHGFRCDSSGSNPIAGVRFKATSALDRDITEACRRQGHYPTGGAGWRPLPDATWALRAALTAVLDWWQLLWPSRGDLFASPPDLMPLSLEDLARAVLQIPFQPQ